MGLCQICRHIGRKVSKKTVRPELMEAMVHVCELKYQHSSNNVVVNAELNICGPCWILITRKSQNRMEVEPIFQHHHKAVQVVENQCFVCDALNPNAVVLFDARVMFFLKTGFFIPHETRCCQLHLNRVSTDFVPDLRLHKVNVSDETVFFTSNEQSEWITGLFQARQKHDRIDMFSHVLGRSEEDFKTLLGVTKTQFQVLCDLTQEYRDTNRLRCRPENLILLLLMLRNADFMNELKAFFGFKSKGAVSSRIRVARKALMQEFVPRYLGPASMTRENFLQHVTPLAKILHLSPDDNEHAVLIIDGTYVYIEKSSNYLVLKRSYCVHKNKHLLKMTMVVFPDGYIFDAHGPYLSDAKNNDASTLKHDLQNNISGLKTWLQLGDVIVVDRGYDDGVQYVQDLGVEVEMPAFLAKGEKQFPTVVANLTRKLTKSRWIVESRNGLIKQAFKFFDRTVHVGNVPNIGDYFRICCAIINAFHPVIEQEGDTEAMGTKILSLLHTSNDLQSYLESKGVLNPRIRTPWRKLDATEAENFPRMTLDELRDLAIGCYQVKQAPSYAHETGERDGFDNYEVYREEPNILKVRMWSRHSNAKKYVLFIRFEPNKNGTEGIHGYYCECKVGARTVGMCAHVCATLWYLSIARYEPRIPTPGSRILKSTLDAAHRFRMRVVDEDDVAEPSQLD